MRISTHAPHTGSDWTRFDAYNVVARFQLTLPIRGAIPDGRPHGQQDKDFNSRSPYGERSNRLGMSNRNAVFQLTLPIRGAINNQQSMQLADIFQLTLPIRGAMSWWFPAFRPSRNFNSRSPYGERSISASTTVRRKNFNSRSPYGERSVHPIHPRTTENFNSRSPYGER